MKRVMLEVSYFGITGYLVSSVGLGSPYKVRYTVTPDKNKADLIAEKNVARYLRTTEGLFDSVTVIPFD